MSTAPVIDLAQPMLDEARDPEAVWIYVVQAGGYGGLLKIGRTSNLTKRLVELQRGTGEELQVVGAWRDLAAREKELHEQYAGLRVRGEWFLHALPLIRLARDFNTWGGAK